MWHPPYTPEQVRAAAMGPDRFAYPYFQDDRLLCAVCLVPLPERFGGHPYVACPDHGDRGEPAGELLRFARLAVNWVALSEEA